MRFLLGFLHYHQARNATAESWLCDGLPLHRWIESADAKELLLVANGRAQSHDWQSAFMVYRAYIRSMAGHSEALNAVLTLLHQSAPLPAALAGLSSIALSSEVPRTASANQRGDSMQVGAPLSAKRADDCKRTTLAVRELIESDLTRPLLVSDIAARLGIARRTIENRVRLECGTSVKRFVTELRLRHAYRMVLDRAPVDVHVLQSIAIQVGFSSYRAFCAAYTRSYGRIPLRRGRPRSETW
jgi:AraC-like DNA-binding protein